MYITSYMLFISKSVITCSQSQSVTATVTVLCAMRSNKVIVINCVQLSRIDFDNQKSNVVIRNV